MGELSTTIVHELGQPVGAVTLNAETARLLIERNRAWIGGDAGRFAVLHELIDDIVRDSRRAETVIGQLRRLMRREQRDREPVNIAIVVSEVLDLVRAELRKHDIAVEWEVSGEGLDVVVNRPQLHQVLLNIILNARDAMESVPVGARRLRVTLRRVPVSCARLPSAWSELRNCRSIRLSIELPSELASPAKRTAVRI